MSSVSSTFGLGVQRHSFDRAEKGEDFVDENGVRTTIEYVVNDDGKKVKVLDTLFPCVYYR